MRRPHAEGRVRLQTGPDSRASRRSGSSDNWPDITSWRHIAGEGPVRNVRCVLGSKPSLPAPTNPDDAQSILYLRCGASGAQHFLWDNVIMITPWVLRRDTDGVDDGELAVRRRRRSLRWTDGPRWCKVRLRMCTPDRNRLYVELDDGNSLESVNFGLHRLRRTRQAGLRLTGSTPMVGKRLRYHDAAAGIRDAAPDQAMSAGCMTRAAVGSPGLIHERRHSRRWACEPLRDEGHGSKHDTGPRTIPITDTSPR